MGRLYEQVRKDIEKLRQLDEAIKNKQLVSMDEVFEASVALQKINYVITYAQQTLKIPPEELGRFPLGQFDHFNLPEDFEGMTENWEDGLSEEQIDHAINHLKLQDQAEPYVPEITPHDPKGYCEYVDNTLDKIIANSQTGHFGISREGVIVMTLSAQQELVKNIFDQDYALDPSDKENQWYLDFIDSPIEETVNRHEEQLGLNGHNEVKEFIRTQKDFYTQIVNQSEHPQAFKEVTEYAPVAKALEPIHTSKWNPKDLSAAVEDSVRNYIRDYKGKKDEMNIGSFVSLVRDRVESSIFDHATQLGEDADSQFIKDFLANPIQSLQQRYRGPSINETDVNNELNARCAQRLGEEQENYNQARVGKVDRFAQIEVSKKQRFHDFFAQQNPDFNPATFKQQYSGSAFERFLGRTSREWTELSDYIDSWKNVGQEQNFDRASELATRYLIHKFPNVDPKDVTPEMCQGLRGAGKERGLFCLSLVHGKGIAEDQVNQEIYDQANARFDQLENRLHRGRNFQDELAGDVGEENDGPNNDNEIENDNLIVKNNDINI